MSKPIFIGGPRHEEPVPPEDLGKPVIVVSIASSPVVKKGKLSAGLRAVIYEKGADGNYRAK